MIIAIDESGVHAQTGKSVIALVCVESKCTVKVEALISKAELRSGIKTFHWSKRNWEMRRAFIQTVAPGEFKLKLAYVQNPIILGDAILSALPILLSDQRISMILIDGDKSKIYSKKLKKVLRDRGVSAKKIRFVNDESFPVVRLADAVAGLARAANELPEGKASELFSQIQDKVSVSINL
jgi:Protein of unknown function (DUF3800)